MNLLWTLSKVGGLKLQYVLPLSACAIHFDEQGRPAGWRVNTQALEEGHPLRDAGHDFILLPREECEPCLRLADVIHTTIDAPHITEAAP